MNEQNSEILAEVPQEVAVETAPEEAPVAAPEEITPAPPAFTNPLFREPGPKDTQWYEPVHTPSLVLGILSIVFSLLIVLIGEILGIIGICLAAKNRWEYRTTAGLVCSIVGLVLSVLTHILNIIVLMGA